MSINYEKLNSVTAKINKLSGIALQINEGTKISQIEPFALEKNELRRN